MLDALKGQGQTRHLSERQAGALASQRQSTLDGTVPQASHRLKCSYLEREALQQWECQPQSWPSSFGESPGHRWRGTDKFEMHNCRAGMKNNQ